MRSCGLENGDAVGTGIEIGVGQAVARDWDRGVSFHEKGIGREVVECVLVINTLSDHENWRETYTGIERG